MDSNRFKVFFREVNFTNEDWSSLEATDNIVCGWFSMLEHLTYRCSISVHPGSLRLLDVDDDILSDIQKLLVTAIQENKIWFSPLCYQNHWVLLVRLPQQLNLEEAKETIDSWFLFDTCSFKGHCCQHYNYARNVMNQLDGKVSLRVFPKTVSQGDSWSCGYRVLDFADKLCEAFKSSKALDLQQGVQDSQSLMERIKSTLKKIWNFKSNNYDIVDPSSLPAQNMSEA